MPYKCGVELEDPRLVPVPITAICVASLDDVQILDANTISSLQIFHKEAHPGTARRGGSKEGLSLYGICNKTKSAAGSKLLKQVHSSRL